MERNVKELNLSLNNINNIDSNSISYSQLLPYSYLLTFQPDVKYDLLFIGITHTNFHELFPSQLILSQDVISLFR